MVQVKKFDGPKAFVEEIGAIFISFIAFNKSSCHVVISQVFFFSAAAKKKRENFIFCRCCFFPFFCLILYIFPSFFRLSLRGCAALESFLFDLHVTRLCRSEDNFCVATMGHMHQAAAARRAKRFRKKVKDVHKMNIKKG